MARRTYEREEFPRERRPGLLFVEQGGVADGQTFHQIAQVRVYLRLRTHAGQHGGFHAYSRVRRQYLRLQPRFQFQQPVQVSLFGQQRVEVRSLVGAAQPDDPSVALHHALRVPRHVEREHRLGLLQVLPF